MVGSSTAQSERELLRSHGYYWRKFKEPGRLYETWHLFDSQGQEVRKEDALRVLRACTCATCRPPQVNIARMNIVRESIVHTPPPAQSPTPLQPAVSPLSRMNVVRESIVRTPPPAQSPASLQPAVSPPSQRESFPGSSVCQWACDLLSRHPLFLDTETTGFGGRAEIIEIALVASDGTIVFESYAKNQEAIQPGAARTHGITQNMLAAAPLFPSIWPRLLPLLTDHEIVIYNAGYDTQMLKQTAARYGLVVPELRTHCLLQRYTAYAQQQPVVPKSFKLDAACDAFGIPPIHHRASGDAEAARQVFLKLAARLEAVG